MKLVRTVYSTNNGMNAFDGQVNAQGGGVAIGCDDDGLYSVNVITLPKLITAGPLINRPDGYTLVNRDELRLIRDAIDLELQRQ